MRQVTIEVENEDQANIAIEVLTQYLEETLTPYSYIEVSPDGKKVTVCLSGPHKPAPVTADAPLPASWPYHGYEMD